MNHPRLKKPGWLPTAIVANVIGPDSDRDGIKVDDRDRVQIRQEDGRWNLITPDGSEHGNWALRGKLRPIEIIDGQHRLLAFGEGDTVANSFDLPVVLFNDLDISWQAYLFWIINIRPKRISQSFAYDLYPLLRTQDWLENVEGPVTYRETRAQELTECLWSHPQSPWHNRISMLGRDRKNVSQAAWVRSLTVTFVRPWERAGSELGGLFGAPLTRTDNATVLTWNRPQQAAYLIRLWSHLEEAVRSSRARWTESLVTQTDRATGANPAFNGTTTLLNTVNRPGFDGDSDR
jgi:DGQHR domain-containing protein